MDNEVLENQDALNPEGEEQQPEADEGTPDVSEKLTKAEELAKNQKIRAEKAEAEVKKLKAEQQKPKEEKSNEPDYSEKIDRLTLKSEGITHPDDQKLVLAEAKRLQLSVEEVAGMEYIKAKLKVASEQREAETGMPSGKGKSGGSTKNTVEYWVDKRNKDGTFDTPSDPELAEKVIDARIHREEADSRFSEIRF